MIVASEQQLKAQLAETNQSLEASYQQNDVTTSELLILKQEAAETNAIHAGHIESLEGDSNKLKL